MQDQLGNRAMDLEVQYRAAEHTLKRRNEECSRHRRETCRHQQPTEIAEQAAACERIQIGLDALRQKRAQKGIRGARHEHENAEQGQRNGNPLRPDAGDTNRISERTDQVNHEREEADDEKLCIHVLVVHFRELPPRQRIADVGSPDGITLLDRL